MAGLAAPPGFADNEWTEQQWARAQAMTGARFLVYDTSAWKPTVSTTADRTITIAAGRGYACGVYDETTGAETVAFDPNTSGATRYDLLVARFNWATNTRSFVVIKGGANPPPVNQTQTVDASSVNRIPGVQYDGVIGVAAVRPNVGTFAATDFEDLRLVDTGSGPLARPSSSAYLELSDLRTGATVHLPATAALPARLMMLSGGAWRMVSPTSLPSILGPWREPPGFWLASLNPSLITSVAVPDPGFPYRLKVVAACEMGSVSPGTRWDMWVRVTGGGVGNFDLDHTVANEELTSYQRIDSPLSDQILTGPSTVIVEGRKPYGTANGNITGFNKMLRVYRHAA